MANAVPVTAKVTQEAVNEVAAMRAAATPKGKSDDAEVQAIADAAAKAGKNVIVFSNMVRVDN